MPSAITVADFEDEQILTFEQLKAFKDAVIARFSAGIASGDIGWPLTAQGNLDMSIYNLLGGRKIWGFVNTAEYDTLSDAITAAGSGGVVLIPPETTITTAGGEVHNGSGATIIGSGPSSVLKFDASPSAGYLMRADTGSGLMFANLTFDGNSAAGTGQIGLDLQGVSNVLIDSCWFQNFSGPALNISNGCSGIMVRGCWFTGGSAEHIYATESGRLGIEGLHSVSAGTIALRLQSASATAEVIAIIDNAFIVTPGSNGINAYGANATGSASPAEVYATGVKIKSAGSDAAVLGTSAQALARVSWTGGVVYGPAGDGLVVHASEGAISGVSISTPITNCIDLGTSRHMQVSGNTFKAATVGVDASLTAAECRITGNTCISCTDNVILGGTGLVQYGNGDQVAAPPANCFANFTDYAVVTTLNQLVFTIPGGTLRVGDILKYSVFYSANNGTANQALGLSLQFTSGKYLGQTDTHGSEDGVLQGVALVTGATTIRGFGWGFTDTGNEDVNYHDLTTIDLTADNGIYAGATNPSGTTDAYIRGVVLEILHAEV